jgi:hypothetical protein
MKKEPENEPICDLRAAASYLTKLRNESQSANEPQTFC